jgi:enamine deaminase RidA (YjgF/YER057c/UK114 family)
MRYGARMRCRYSNRDQLLVEIGINSLCGIAALFGHWLFTRYHVGTPINAGDPSPYDRSSRAVVVDRTVYTSAVGGSKKDSKLHGVSSGATSSDEARAACLELKEILEGVGSACDKVVKATVYTTPDADVDAVVAVYEEFFAQGPPPQPALSLSMAAQLPWGRRVQIDVVATI